MAQAHITLVGTIEARFLMEGDVFTVAEGTFRVTAARRTGALGSSPAGVQVHAEGADGRPFGWAGWFPGGQLVRFHGRQV